MRTISLFIISLLFSTVSTNLSGQGIKIENGAKDKFGNTPQLFIFNSTENLKCDDTVRVYTPEGKINGTLILLHGWSGCYRDWGDKMNIQKISNEHNFRIITPDGFYNSWYVDNSDKEKMQTRTFFNQELIPFFYKYFKLDSLSTFIDGLSMGGHGAVNIFIDNYSLFRAAGSMSGVLTLSSTTLTKELEKVFGEELEERSQSESADVRIEKIAGGKKLILVSCGYSDYYFKCTASFIEKCTTLKVPYIRSDTPGTHSWKFWEFALNQHLWYFNRIISGEEMGYSI